MKIRRTRRALATVLHGIETSKYKGIVPMTSVMSCGHFVHVNPVNDFQ